MGLTVTARLFCSKINKLTAECDSGEGSKRGQNQANLKKNKKQWHKDLLIGGELKNMMLLRKAFLHFCEFYANLSIYKCVSASLAAKNSNHHSVPRGHKYLMRADLRQ